MAYLDYTDKLEMLKYLVERKQAGTPRQLAKKLRVSERNVQRMVQRLRDHGYPVTFNRSLGTYEIDDT